MAVPPPSPDDKPALRATLRQARSAYLARMGDDKRADAEAAAAGHVLDHITTPGITVAVYRAFGSEIDPAPLAGILAARGLGLALPHVATDGITMRFVAWDPGDPLVRTPFGILQPAAGREVAPTIVLTPLVGFDRSGGRVGQGAGHYDRAFAALPGAIRIGYAWSVQEVPHVPHDPWDVRLHAIATEKEWIAVEPAQ
jgi:5-formyltetrahydrofolate cyclo-ligase